MREILFRAKRIDDGEWTEGYVFELQPGQYMICDAKQYDRASTLPAGAFFRYCSHEIDPETLCQYTGLKDKKGNRIWEKDIVDASKEWWSASGPAGHDCPLIEVEWIDGITGYEPFANYDCDCGVYIDASGCEVVGNIFDNPELLD